MVIEADSASLQNFLKTTGTAVATTTPVATPASNPLAPVNESIGMTTDSLDKFTNLLEAVNKLLSQPLVSGVLNKGADRKAGYNSPKAEVIEVPEGYNPPNNTIDTSRPKRVEVPASIDKTEKATLFYDALLGSVAEMVKQKPDRTIKEIHEELAQEVVKEELIKQIKVIM